MENIQSVVQEIHRIYGVTEMSNYKIQLLFDYQQRGLKGLLRECYNVITGGTGLDCENSPVQESSLSRRVKEAINS